MGINSVIEQLVTTLFVPTKRGVFMNREPKAVIVSSVSRTVFRSPAVIGSSVAVSNYGNKERPRTWLTF